jgi:hypothetical protein
MAALDSALGTRDWLSALDTHDWLAVALVLLFCADLGLVLVLNRRLRRAAELIAPAVAPSPATAPTKIPKLSRSLLFASCWLALDAFVMQQGLISIILLLLCVFWMAPSVLMARKDKSLARFRAGRVAAYFLAAIAALGIIRLNNSLAERRAEVVVAAVRQYQQKNGRYPQRLEEVTPEFLPAIPRARYSFMWNNFMYFNAGSSQRLVYVAFPPFLRRVYNFESGSWGQID